MRYLIAESYPFKPHLETAGEVALQALDDGHEVGFAWLGENLPWSDGGLSAGKRGVRRSLERRVHPLEQLLAEAGVEILGKQVDGLGWESMAKDWSESFVGGMDALKRYSYQGICLGIGAASSLISHTADSCYDPIQDLTRTRACLATALLVYLRAERVIRDFKPDVVITFNGRLVTSKPIVCAAERVGIKVLRHERGWTYSHYEIFSDSIHNFDYIQRRIQGAWEIADSSERTLLANQFYQRKRAGDGIGWYSFTTEQIKGFVPDRVAGKRRLVYFSSSDDEYAAVEDGFECGPWSSQLCAVRDLIEIQSYYSDLELIIRVHPHLSKKSAAERERWALPTKAGVTVIGPHETVDSYALLDSADIVASYGSTIGIEAAYWGKPSLLLGPSVYHNSGAVINPTGRDELITLLDPTKLLIAPTQEKCLPYGYYYHSFGRKYRYYVPESLSEGRLLGHHLRWHPWYIFLLRKMRVGRLYRRVKKRLGIT